MPTTPRDPTRGWGLVALGSFSAISPLCTDIYTPSLPEVVTDLDTTAAGVQLTLTGFMLGLAVGQLIIGSLSDALGRRRLLLLGGFVCVLATLGCAVAPNITTFVGVRVLQGFTGAAGVVLARAIIADTADRTRAAQLLGALAAIVGIAPVAAPLLGAGLAHAFGWRGLFVAIAVFMTAVTLVAVRAVPESLPPGRRHPLSPSRMARSIGTILTRRAYLGYLLTFVAAFGAFFSYVSASSFIYRTQHGFSALGYGVLFAAGAACMTASALVAARLAGRVRYDAMLAVGTTGLVIGAAGAFVASRLDTPLWLFIPSTLVLTTSMGQIMSNATARALAQTPDVAGTGSAVLGTSQFLAAAVVAPLVGLAGDTSPRPFGIAVIVCAVLAVAAFHLLARRTPPETTTESTPKNQ